MSISFNYLGCEFLSCNGVGSVQVKYLWIQTMTVCLTLVRTESKTGSKIRKWHEYLLPLYRYERQLLDLPSEGVFEVSAHSPNDDLWESCVLSQTITVDNTTNETVDFPVQPLLDCALMSVDLSTPMLRRCFNSNYHVKYCNEGTVSATGAYV
ncbi:MAG: hypothetical protein R2788_13355 [Saprospiraceae bacterium]